jgi:hypothetical protein
MTKPHKYADLIKAWADGQEIEVSKGNSRWCVVDHPSWSDSLLYRIKPAAPVVKWQAERDAYYRGEAVQWRYTAQPHDDWFDLCRAPKGLFDDPGYEFRIKLEWQEERDAHARGEVIQCRLKSFPNPYDKSARWSWALASNPIWDDAYEYRLKPKTIKTRVRAAAMGAPNGEGRIWVWSVHTDEHAAQTERNGHFLCWLGDWHEVERPEPTVEDTLSVGFIDAAKISERSITTEKTALGALGAMHAMGFDAAKSGSDRTVVWCSNGEWPPSGGFSWGIR